MRLNREAEEGILGVKRKIYKETMEVGVIAQGCGQTLGLGLEQSKDIVVVFY